MEKKLLWESVLGMSTDIELEKLKEAYPKPEIGDEYTYDELADIIGIERKESRFRTVVNRWNKYLLTQHICLKCVRGVGYCVADHEKRLEIEQNHSKKAQRQYKKAVRVLSTIDRDELPDYGKRAYDLDTNHLAKHIQFCREADKEKRMLPPKAREPKRA